VPRALITGIRGQDGRYLAEFLVEKGYEVFGLVHDVSPDDPLASRDLPRVGLVYGDLTDTASLIRACDEVQPDELYNLGSQSAVDLSFREPSATARATALGPLNVLEAISILRSSLPNIKFYQASSSEMFGSHGELPYSEETTFHPQSPYAFSKVFAHHATQFYREAYGIFAATGICFNHESPRRGQNFVTRKVSLAVARIASGLQSTLVLGNLDSRRDWGFAGDYVEAMWLIMQHTVPDDFVISTGESHTVREFVELAFARVGICDWQKYVTQDQKFFRPLDPDLCGDSSKARSVLGWKPTVSFDQLVNMMVDADLKLVTTSRRARG
jgi:GDPmannose 4,6-dehydratase